MVDLHPVRLALLTHRYRFKLHLRSRYGPGGETITQQIPPLPPRRTVVQVFADFLRYLMECTVTYIQDTHPNGVELYDSLKGDTSFVLSHPNGWEGSEQSEMRRAAVLAGRVPDTPAGHARLSFVTEGEASLHFAIENNVLSTALKVRFSTFCNSMTLNFLKKGDGVIVVDAGGGTVDISTYRQSPTGDGTVLEEIAAPQCTILRFTDIFSVLKWVLGQAISKALSSSHSLLKHFFRVNPLTSQKGRYL